jgi:hypothetical protein
VMRGVLPLLEQLGIATADELDADTLADRLEHDVKVAGRNRDLAADGRGVESSNVGLAAGSGSRPAARRPGGSPGVAACRPRGSAPRRTCAHNTGHTWNSQRFSFVAKAATRPRLPSRRRRPSRPPRRRVLQRWDAFRSVTITTALSTGWRASQRDQPANAGGSRRAELDHQRRRADPRRT